MYVEQISHRGSTVAVDTAKRFIYYGNSPWYGRRWYLLFLLLIPAALFLLVCLRRRRRTAPVVTQQPFQSQPQSYPTQQTGGSYYNQQGTGYGQSYNTAGAGYVPPSQPQQSYNAGNTYSQAGYGPSHVVSDDAPEVSGTYSRPEGPPPTYKS